MIPLCDFILYPALRKLKIRFTPLRRMLTGYFVACAAMIWAAIVQYYIYKKGACGHCECLHRIWRRKSWHIRTLANVPYQT